METKIIVSDKEVTLLRNNHSCDWFGDEYNINYQVHDEQNDNTKYLFVSSDSRKEADNIYNYLINHSDELYLEAYVSSIDGTISWFDSLKIKDWDKMLNECNIERGIID